MMARYRNKPVELDAWQVGGDEPAPEWAKMACMFRTYPKTSWLIRGEIGGKVHVFCLPSDYFEQIYEAAEGHYESLPTAPNHEINWMHFFGTTEKAAKTLTDGNGIVASFCIDEGDGCLGCRFSDSEAGHLLCYDTEVVQAWLEKEYEV